MAKRILMGFILISLMVVACGKPVSYIDSAVPQDRAQVVKEKTSEAWESEWNVG